MWGKNSKPAPEPSAPAPANPAALPAEPPRREPAAVREAARESSSLARIGVGVSIRGEIRGSEDLRIDGEVHGSVRLENATVTVGSQGRVYADVEAREIVVEGRVDGSLDGRERVRITATGKVRGDIRTHRIAIDEGAILRGSVDIVRPGESRAVPAVKSFAASAAVAKAPSPSVLAEPAGVRVPTESSTEKLQ